MTSTNTGPQPITTDLPPNVLRNWHDSYTAIQRAEQIKAHLPGLDEQITQAQERLAFLTSEHKRAGRDITAALTDAETSREMVELWCAKHGRELPAEPDLTAAAGEDTGPRAQAGVRVTPCMEDPARHGDCGDVFCPCVHHQAERDAFSEEQSRVADVLGNGVAGQTTTQTVLDGTPVGGGGAGDGDFQPGNGDGRGEGRA